MPRKARVKFDEAVYHVMVRSISEVPLYCDNKDKEKYIFFVRRSLKTYHFKVLAYCIMDNHAHFVIDGSGADISKVMHNINFCYAMYFNKRHGRHGHLFQDRFKSKIVYDDAYLLNVTAYVHNNPCDIDGFHDNPEDYEFSSLPVYLGTRGDKYGLVSTRFVNAIMGCESSGSRDRYRELVLNSTDEGMKAEIEFKNEGTRYESCRRIIHRDIDPEKIIRYICATMNLRREKLHIKCSRDTIKAKSLMVVLMRCLCGYTSRDVCGFIGDITQSTASRYFMKGCGLMEQGEYSTIVEDFLQSQVS